MLSWLLVSAFSACKVTAEDLAAVPTIPSSELVAPPPSAAGPGQERLFQLLYAGESGDAAWEIGQRVRVRAWLSSIHLRDVELEGLKRVVGEVRAAAVAADTAELSLPHAELVALSPVYEALYRRLGAGSEPTDEELAVFAEKLSAARVLAHGDTPPEVTRQERVRVLLDIVARWQGQLPQDTQLKLSEARFFLVRRASPFGNPGAYHTLVGLDWDGGEFSTLNETEAPADQPQMDIGGLWALEKLRAPPGKYLSARQVQAIVVLASMEPALVEALGLTSQSPTPALPPPDAPPQ